MKNTATGFKRILKAFTFSFDGFKAAFHDEAAFRQDLMVCLAGMIALFFLKQPLIETALMAFSLFFILFAELVNSAVEAVIDRISSDYHILSKKAKDIGSLLVLLSFINAGVIWILCLYPQG